MGGLFGSGRRQTAAAATPAPGTAIAEDPRPMPDPESPAALRAEREERRRITQRSGRASTDLTRRNRIGGSTRPTASGNKTPMAIMRTPTAMG